MHQPYNPTTPTFASSPQHQIYLDLQTKVMFSDSDSDTDDGGGEPMWDADDAGAPEPTPDELQVPPLSNPPLTHQLWHKHYDSLDELHQDLVKWAASAMFGITKLRATNKVAGVGYTRVDYGCWRDKIRPNEGFSRNSVTKKRN
ncbi:hypothetical protein QBC37DRAFT_375150, partial [Rhypophila decipiens]